MLDSEELFYILFSPDFNVQSLHFKIVSFLLADFQDSVLRIYRQKLHESFLLLPFSPFSPREPDTRDNSRCLPSAQLRIT